MKRPGFPWLRALAAILAALAFSLPASAQPEPNGVCVANCDSPSEPPSETPSYTPSYDTTPDPEAQARAEEAARKRAEELRAYYQQAEDEYNASAAASAERDARGRDLVTAFEAYQKALAGATPRKVPRELLAPIPKRARSPIAAMRISSVAPPSTRASPSRWRAGRTRSCRSRTPPSSTPSGARTRRALSSTAASRPPGAVASPRSRSNRAARRAPTRRRTPQPSAARFKISAHRTRRSRRLARRSTPRTPTTKKRSATVRQATRRGRQRPRRPPRPPPTPTRKRRTTRPSASGWTRKWGWQSRVRGSRSRPSSTRKFLELLERQAAADRAAAAARDEVVRIQNANKAAAEKAKADAKADADLEAAKEKARDEAKKKLEAEQKKRAEEQAEADDAAAALAKKDEHASARPARVYRAAPRPTGHRGPR